MAAIDQAMVSKILNQTTPTGAAGIPGTFGTALSTSAMKVKLTSTASSASASGTELTGTGYTTGGTALGTASTASTAGSAVTLPAGSALSWTNGSGGSWSIVSVELTDNAGVRVWYGNFTGQPITVTNGQIFQIAVGAISVGLS
ncbi:MAG: hypothetical protein JWO67_2576 [Streptosporangiaceae bacterium]|nr:hypothetical protein [Streptosporangiaceae bacterium]